MNVQPYVTQVQEQLAAAAALGDEQARAVAAALGRAAEPAVRLAILAAVSAAGDEITAALLDAPGAPRVSVRLDADEVRVDVSSAEPVAAPRGDDGDATARVSLRLSEALKTDVEAAASGAGVSVNTWLVRAAAAALTPGWGGWGPTWPGPGGGPAGGPGPGGRRGGGHRVTGWVAG